MTIWGMENDWFNRCWDLFPHGDTFDVRSCSRRIALQEHRETHKDDTRKWTMIIFDAIYIFSRSQLTFLFPLWANNWMKNRLSKHFTTHTGEIIIRVRTRSQGSQKKEHRERERERGGGQKKEDMTDIARICMYINVQIRSYSNGCAKILTRRKRSTCLSWSS